MPAMSGKLVCSEFEQVYSKKFEAQTRNPKKRCGDVMVSTPTALPALLLLYPKRTYRGRRSLHTLQLNKRMLIAEYENIIHLLTDTMELDNEYDELRTNEPFHEGPAMKRFCE